MKDKFLKLFLLMSFAVFALQPLRAQFGQPAEEAKEISQEEAAKKYPPPKGGYPVGELTASAGIVKSPYPPHRVFKTHVYGKDGKPIVIKRGALILDAMAKKVFVNP